MIPITIFVADRNPLFRRLLLSMFRLFPEFRTVGEASTTPETLAKIKSIKPDIVMMEYDLPEGDAIETIWWTRKNFPSTKVIILTESENVDRIIDIIEAGACGYLTKGKLSITEIIDCIKQASKKSSIYSPFRLKLKDRK